MSFRRPIYKKHFFNIDVNLVDVLNIDEEKQVQLNLSKIVLYRKYLKI